MPESPEEKKKDSFTANKQTAYLSTFETAF